MATYEKYVIAREQYYLDNDGKQFCDGFDPLTVVGEGRTLAAACRRAGGWESRSGYFVFDGKTGEFLGSVMYGERGPEVHKNE